MEDLKSEKRFCQYCGTKLDIGVRFCKSCGKPIEQSGSSAAGCTPPQTEETFSHKQHTERKTVYEGQLHKCPNIRLLKIGCRNDIISHCVIGNGSTKYFDDYDDALEEFNLRWMKEKYGD